MDTQKEIAAYRKSFARCERDAAKAKNPQIWYAWNESVKNAIDTMQEGGYSEFLKCHGITSEEWDRTDYFRYMAVATCGGFVTDSTFTAATRNWFAKRGVVG